MTHRRAQRLIETCSACQIALVVKPVTLAQYIASPVGNAWIGRSTACWFAPSGVRAISIFDSPTHDDVLELVQALQADTCEGIPPTFSSWVDLRRASSIDPGAFQALFEYMQTQRDFYAQRVTQSVIIQRGGTVGALAAGYTRLLGDPFPVTIFSDLSSALGALSLSDEERVRFAEGIQSLDDAAARGEQWVTRLRHYLAENLQAASLASAAHALAVAPRTLQRGLREEGTAFRSELRQARVRRAQQLLVQTDIKTLAVGLDVGFSTLQNFTDAFRKTCGMTPAEWRQNNRSDISG
ncbi:MAG: helix-turn-helix transcriptional regulator [Myxococcales bacterium]|nr:helix-turn-helix transcriptional regulator [Myxococcales bacterium]